MKWDDFAVQIEDPQPAVFQLGFVNLPTAEIQGVEADLAFTVNDAWSIDGRSRYNDAEAAEASTLTVDRRRRRRFLRSRSRGRATAADAGLERRARRRVPPASVSVGRRRAVRALRLFLRRLVGQFARGHRVRGSGNPVAGTGAYDLGNLRVGLEGENWSGSLFSNNLSDERAELFLNNRWKAQRLSINRPRTIGMPVRYKF